MLTEGLALWSQLQWGAAHWWLLPPAVLGLQFGLGRLGRWRLADPAALPVLLPPPRYRHPALAWLQTQHRAEGRVRARYRGRWQRPLLLLLLSSCLAAALAGPYRLGRQLPEPSPYREVVFLIDTSISMVLRDYLVEGQRVDRMTMVKSVMHHLSGQLQGNRLGVVAYAESAYTLVPLTDDYALLTRMVDRLQPALYTGRTSQLAPALLYADQAFATGDGVRPVLVLITDLQRPFRDMDPEVVAGYLHQRGFTLHTIAIGASTQAAAEAAGGLIYEPANFGLLQALATAGGGRFFRAADTESLQQAIVEIQRSERVSVQGPPRYLHEPLYHYPLALMLFILWLAQLNSVVRRR